VSHQRLRKAFSPVEPKTPAAADALLDLWQELTTGGHPSECVKCFFTLLGQVKSPAALTPLRQLLEERLEVEVCAGNRELESLPLDLEGSADLESFCTRAILTVQMDRAYPDPEIKLRVRFRRANLEASSAATY